MIVMVNGLPGNMAKTVITAAVQRGIEVLPYSLTGADVREDTITHEGIHFSLLHPDTRDTAMEEILKDTPEFISVDYTHPTAVNDNATFYIRHSRPFVMGTTGGDREKLHKDVSAAGLSAVIAPNMAKQIVALQYMLQTMAKTFPDLYKDYTLSVVESHQKTKADTSGTAKAIVDSFNKMGIHPITPEAIEKIREDAPAQERLGVPAEYLSGHAFHTYRVVSPDDTVAFSFSHNVCGRSIYGEGTMDAAVFLQKQIEAGTAERVFSMIDVLQSGTMQ
ncbi:dihydrodipicolinate reductase [Chitinivibrio alkaliphilus]|uniref:4-hydroxy-tetrahydrodipicolinate reductase n=1 Tax=Chitinivibrio alkaliphilus ACht1 TaxID=1313304 RepID=U7D9V6_9BACT|nr:dihydrodipicolinate reductase [Chitinivibrio alkaliphilus]ERP31872.1 dihydrodipicolinate reductase [Chitinivibrio alkaliphilus ACht1]